MSYPSSEYDSSIIPDSKNSQGGAFDQVSRPGLDHLGPYPPRSIPPEPAVILAQDELSPPGGISPLPSGRSFVYGQPEPFLGTSVKEGEVARVSEENPSTNRGSPRVKISASEFEKLSIPKGFFEEKKPASGMGFEKIRKNSYLKPFFGKNGIGGEDSAAGGFHGEWIDGKWQNWLKTAEEGYYDYLGGIRVWNAGLRAGFHPWKSVTSGGVHFHFISRQNEVRFEFGQVPLMVEGLDFVYDRAMAFLLSLGYLVQSDSLSRMDLAIDTFLPVDWIQNAYHEKRIISKGLVRGGFEDGFSRDHQLGDKKTGITCGKGKCVERSYDKEFHTRKDPLARACLIQTRWGEEPKIASRYEFQVRSELLKGFEIEDHKSYQKNKSRLAYYLTHDWLRVVKKSEGVISNDNRNRGRLPTDENWEIIQQGFDLVYGSEPSQIKRRVPNPNRKQIQAQAVAMLMADYILVDAAKGFRDFSADRFFENLGNVLSSHDLLAFHARGQGRLSERINIECLKQGEDLGEK